LAFTLPTMTLFLRTAAAAVSAVAILGASPPEPTPVRQMMPPGHSLAKDWPITGPAPVHSIMISGSKFISETVVW
jgi:hypothetical protein